MDKFMYNKTMPKEKRVKLIVAICVFFVLLISFLTMMILALTGHDFVIDSLNSILFSDRNMFWNGFFKVVTHAGSIFFLILILLVIFMLTRKKYYGIMGFICLFCAGFISTIIKYIVRRPRPEDIALISETGYSFPSTHAVMSMAVFGLIIYFTIKYAKSNALKISVSIAFPIVILLVGISRVYLGVHYFSDVVAGWLLGATLTLGMMIIARIIYHNRRKKKAQAKLEDTNKTN